MKKLIAIFLAVFIAAPAFAGDMRVKIVAKKKSGVSVGCPAWGTYGTADGNILFAWDGSHSSGNTYGCDSDEDAHACANTGGAFSGSGASTTFDITTVDDRCVWTTGIDWSHLNEADPITVWVEFHTEANDVTTSVWEMNSGGSTNYAILRVLSTEYPSLSINVSGLEHANSAGTITADGASLQQVGASTQDADGVDQTCSNVDTPSWTEYDRDKHDWGSDIAQFMLGNYYGVGGSREISINKIVVIAGWEKGCPW